MLKIINASGHVSGVQSELGPVSTSWTNYLTSPSCIFFTYRLETIIVYVSMGLFDLISE